MSRKKDGGALVHQRKGDEEIANSNDMPEPVKIDDAAQALIGHHLRALYGAIVQEPIPDHLIKLLQDLDRKELP